MDTPVVSRPCPPRSRIGRAFALALSFGIAVSSSAFAQQGRKVKPNSPNAFAQSQKLDDELQRRASGGNSSGTTRVIAELQPGASVPPELAVYARQKGKLGIINAQVLDVPNGLLKQLSASPAVNRFHFDRPAKEFNYRTSLTSGTRAVQETLGLTGAGIGVAVVDSGIASWHDDLTATRPGPPYPYGNQRVAAFVDFVNGRTQPYDDDGHGTHVSGIIAGNGYDSSGQKAGAAPDASLISLKVLDANGNGTVSTIIAALDWALANRTRYNIRVVNLSVGATVRESYWTDPLTLAAKRLVDAGIVVVGASGNFGKNAAGLEQYGGITAPGNAPWVLTVGASSTNGTVDRPDDTVADFSSRGPSFIDFTAKPDLVAAGVGTVSLADATSSLYQLLPSALLPGSIPTASFPYLSLSGTSMSAPVVSGTVALMLQANPALTPNAVKAILQYTAQTYPGYDSLTEGAGFLNAVGAIRLARFYASSKPGDPVPQQDMWSRSIIWGNYLMSGGVLDVNASAFGVGTTWGSVLAGDGNQIVWGTVAGGSDQIVWGTRSDDGDQIVWGTRSDDGDQIVWGTRSDDGDQIVWGTGAMQNVVWGNSCGGVDCDGVVWGSRSDDGDQIVWGTRSSDDGDQIVWGTSMDPDQIVWGTISTAADQIVWGTFSGSADQIVWGTVSGSADQIVWGTVSGSTDQIVWGTALTGGRTVWGKTGALNAVVVQGPNGSQLTVSGSRLFDLFSDEQLLRWTLYAKVTPPSDKGAGKGSSKGKGK